ncbi:Tat pathway signal sequence domain protein [Streptomyces sp. NPDC092296]|uniref:Tat pathway signal sequence domain protein n=1 Tax=Streptomyces sp. NPDC092296 TaxID=3366012 RepID=UPI0037F38EBB
MSNAVSRRSFLTAAAAVAGAVTLSPLLTACGGGGDSGRKTGTNSKSGLAAALPAYLPNASVSPDIPSSTGAAGALSPAGFLKYPANPVKSVSGVPGSGGHYTAVTPLWGSIPAANNAYYQAVNKALGATLTMQPANGNTYDTAITALTAGKKLPDWIQLPTWWNPTFNTSALAGTQLADLTPYLSGDNVKKYPNLAAIPTGAWQCGAWGDKLYGIPSYASGQVFTGAIYYRQDVFEAKGIKGEVSSADDLFALGKELTSAKAGVWAFDDVFTYLAQPFGVVNKFTVKDGKLVHKYETDEMLASLEWAHKLAKAGFIHPDALAGDTSNAKTRFYAGKVLITGDGTGAWNFQDAQSGQAADKDYRRGAFVPFAADGHAKPSIALQTTTSFVSYLNKKLTPEQIKECLAIADYLAAPFGSAEYTLLNYGVEGVDYTMTPAGPDYTDTGKKEANQSTYQFLASPEAVISNPGYDQITRDICTWNTVAGKYAYKPVFWNMNITVPARYATADAAQAVEDTIKDVYHGRKTVADFQAAVSTWKKGGGDALIAWYQTNVADKSGTGQ